MKKNLLILATIFLFLQNSVVAQCISITCPSNISMSSALNSCSSTVNYSAPVVINNCSSNSFTFSYTGGTQTFIVPNGVTNLTMEAWGAQGGANWVNNTNFGGYSKGDFSVTPGQTLTIYVGGQATSTIGGYNGGGIGEGLGKGGGGASDVRIASFTLNDRVIVAGGGGGAGYWSSLHVVGGIGGGLIGGDGYRDTPANPGGQGGTQTGSGNGTCVSLNNPAMAGGFGFGGNVSGCGCEGYGGGGGWYGGAGSGNCRGGGGGSGYLLPSATNTLFTSGVTVGNGKVILTYFNTSTYTTSLVAGLASGSSFPNGTTVQTFSVVDNNLNSNSCSFSVTINDVQTPTIVCPTNYTSCATSVNSISPVSVLDNCSATVTYSLSGATTGTGVTSANGVFNLGVTNVYYTAADPSGNSASCNFSLTVNISPTVNIASSNSLICSGQSVTLTASTSTDVTSYSWTPTSTINPIVVTPTVTSTYSLLVTNSANGCSSSTNITQNVSACTGLINQNKSAFKLSVFPNPNKGSFIISVSDNAELQILNALGQVVLSKIFEIGENEVDLKTQPNGLYFAVVKINENFYFEKIIKQ
ncbi:MAG: glycine-rich protein [Bacteroidota bacterium]|nr:glycine-rich protein [Bacteroidota bacterium]MDP3144979.1 glycine-rich protein [Bacteroidota bacterium]MDP3556011.1 glycine-rich protein [Bacteroidota bacterium]